MNDKEPYKICLKFDGVKKLNLSVLILTNTFQNTGTIIFNWQKESDFEVFCWILMARFYEAHLKLGVSNYRTSRRKVYTYS